MIRRSLILCAGWVPLVAIAAMAITERAAEAPIDTAGFLYGRVESRQGTFEGRLRWGDEEAFWDDHLNGSKYQRPYLDAVPEDRRGRRRTVKLFGIEIGSRWQAWEEGRQLVVRFGDIARIERRGRRHILVIKSGSEIALKGGSNDLRGALTVWDRTRGETTLDLQEIHRITFLPAPPDLVVGAQRMFGTVTTTAGSFHGFVQWDLEECLSSDILDGDDSRGQRHKIAFGELRQIARRSDASARITLKDGSELVLDGTNDVNRSNRGIMIEDPRFGRVAVAWASFERVDFEPPPSSGHAYSDFGDTRPLRGTVHDTSGHTRTGRIIYDIDESETWDILNGRREGIDYNIPFSLIRAIEPIDENSSRVELADGTGLELNGATDVGGNHAGLLVLTEDGRSTYLAWSEVQRLRFE